MNWILINWTQICLLKSMYPFYFPFVAFTEFSQLTKLSSSNNFNYINKCDFRLEKTLAQTEFMDEPNDSDEEAIVETDEELRKSYTKFFLIHCKLSQSKKFANRYTNIYSKFSSIASK